MGGIADAIMAYTKPLLDQTDGSIEQMNKALALGQMCYNLALVPEGRRDQAIDDLRSSLEMDDQEFANFRSSIVLSMIQRHHDMFPQLHRSHRRDLADLSPPEPFPTAAHFAADQQKPARSEKFPGASPYAPCPCNSGKKYKFCCRQTVR
jgi:hypothetical protein